jgi:hypothetical protein
LETYVTGSAKGKISWRRWWFPIAMLVVAGTVVIGFYRVRNRPEHVKVTVRNAPGDALHWGVVFDIDGQVHSIPLELSLHGPGPLIAADKFIRWKPANRYGIVTERIDESWWVTWFEPSQVPVVGRSLLFGGGCVDFDLATGLAEKLSRAQAKRLGLVWGENRH